MDTGSGDLLFHQGDQINNMYFINEGSIKLISNLNDFIIDDALTNCVNRYIQVTRDFKGENRNNQEQDVLRLDQAGIIPIVKLVQSSSFGDCDVLGIQ